MNAVTTPTARHNVGGILGTQLRQVANVNKSLSSAMGAEPERNNSARRSLFRLSADYFGAAPPKR
jgi:hypothetical protein